MLQHASPSGKSIRFEIADSRLSSANLKYTLINLPYPVHNITVAKILDLITQTAERPLEYVIQNNAVVFKHVPAARRPGAIPRTSGMNPHQQRLRDVVVSEFDFAGMDLETVVMCLIDDVRRDDPTTKEPNFLFAPLRYSERGRRQFENSLINHKSRMLKVNLESVLNAAVKASAFPIRYVVEDYGIVIEPLDTKLMVNPTTKSSATWANSRTNRIGRKLNEILISEIAYDSLTLDEVVADLLDTSRRNDPKLSLIHI